MELKCVPVSLFLRSSSPLFPKRGLNDDFSSSLFLLLFELLQTQTSAKFMREIYAL